MYNAWFAKGNEMKAWWARGEKINIFHNSDNYFIHFTTKLQAYDNVESSVRKASVFCMVALHQLVGENLQPHLSCLNGSKLKLLNLYIKRAQAQSTPASPRLTTPP